MANKPHIILRKALMEDTPLLLHWDEQPHVIAASPNEEYHWDRSTGNELGGHPLLLPDRISFKERRQFDEDLCLVLVLERSIWDGIRPPN